MSSPRWMMSSNFVLWDLPLHLFLLISVPKGPGRAAEMVEVVEQRLCKADELRLHLSSRKKIAKEKIADRPKWIIKGVERVNGEQLLTEAICLTRAKDAEWTLPCCGFRRAHHWIVVLVAGGCCWGQNHELVQKGIWQTEGWRNLLRTVTAVWMYPLMHEITKCKSLKEGKSRMVNSTLLLVQFLILFVHWLVAKNGWQGVRPPRPCTGPLGVWKRQGWEGRDK